MSTPTPQPQSNALPSINLANIRSMEPLATGSYLAHITQATMGTSQAGFKKLDVRWTVDESAHPEYTGRIIFDTLSFHPRAEWKYAQFLMALGWDVEKGETPATTEDLIGRAALLDITAEPERANPNNPGEVFKARNTVKKVRPESAFQPDGPEFS